MGDRVSISFKNGDWESVTLFSHWGGTKFVEDAQEYAAALPRDRRADRFFVTPLDRREPDTVMVDFIRHITKRLDKVDGDLYLGSLPADGDNSDNGHYIIDVS